MQIRLRNGDWEVAAALADGPAAHAFAAQLPLQLEFRDFAASERIAPVPLPLPTHDEPAGHLPAAGDLAYYVPWGNLAVFYRDAPYAEGLIRLGSVDASPLRIRALRGTVTIELDG